MKIIIISYYHIIICIVSQLFFRRFFDMLSTYRLRLILFSKDFFSNSKSRLLCLKHHYNKKFMFMILFKHVLRIRQIMFKNSIIFIKRKFFSTYEIIKFFSLFLIFQNIFYFIFFVFVYENYLRRNNDVCICII